MIYNIIAKYFYELNKRCLKRHIKKSFIFLCDILYHIYVYLKSYCLTLFLPVYTRRVPMWPASPPFPHVLSLLLIFPFFVGGAAIYFYIALHDNRLH